MPTLQQTLENLTVQGELYERIEGNGVRCHACGHYCRIPDGAAGVCKIRFNRGGILRVPFGYVVGAQCDPVEKKPFFHARPGAIAYSFGMLGCDFHCGYCQNWVTSQALRDARSGVRPITCDAREMIREAEAHRAQIVVSTYNEPLITSEWAVAVFKEAKSRGLLTGYVSNGNGTPQVLEYLRPWLDLFKIDLKCYNDRNYRKLGGRLQPILDTIKSVHQLGLWLEVVTLLVPGFNDSEDELVGLTRFIAGVSCDIPWHVTAFHKDYKMTDPKQTQAADLIRAADIGKRAGLKYVYAGNLTGLVGDLEHTYCPGCGYLLIERQGYRILGNALLQDGRCPSCRNVIPGRWSAEPSALPRC